jgi:PAS domain S-box-containing protein
MVTRAVSNSTDYIFAMKPNGDIIFGNQRFKEMHGWKQNEDILSYNILDSKTNWISNKRWLEIINQVTSSSQIVSFVINRPIPENQSVQSFDCTSSLIKDSMGKDLVWTFGKDITERVHYEKQVKELNQIMGTVLSNIPLSISVKDITNDLRYIFSNKSGDDFRSGLASHIIGKTDFEIYPREVAENMRTEDMKIIHEKGETRKTIDYTDENGNNIIIDQLQLYINDDFRPFLITIEQDITKNKQMEQELVDAKEKAEESDRLKSAFIANMSHEIRTPLNAIVGFSRIIAETENIEDRKKYYSIVEANNERLLGLINEILDLSKIESGIMEFDNMPIKMSDFGEDIINTMSLRCPKGVELKYMPSVKDLVILCDKNRLSQVFINLIGNAIKFTTEGSISFGYTEKDGYLEFFVKDTGKGISPDKLEKVFDRFVKADNFTQGTGLGLSICKSIVQRMGGEITVSSQQGSGTCFRFTLPDCGVMYVETESSSFQTQNIGSTNMGFTILVAEDTDSNFKLIEAMISKNYKLVRAMNGIEAITLCKDIKPELILMDIKMPELDGLEATQIIREEFPEIPIIAQSAFAFEDDRKRAIDSGCTDFIAKPFTKKQLMDIVQRYL